MRLRRGLQGWFKCRRRIQVVRTGDPLVMGNGAPVNVRRRYASSMRQQVPRAFGANHHCGVIESKRH